MLVYWRHRLNASARPHRIDEAVKDVAAQTGILNRPSRGRWTPLACALEQRWARLGFSGETLLGDPDGFRVLIDQDEAPPVALGRYAGGAAATEEVGHEVARVARCPDIRSSSLTGFWVG